jgi:hypothetical protein
MEDFFADQAIAIMRLSGFIGFNYLGIRLISSKSKIDTFFAVIFFILAELSLFIGDF